MIQNLKMYIDYLINPSHKLNRAWTRIDLPINVNICYQIESTKNYNNGLIINPI